MIATATQARLALRPLPVAAARAVVVALVTALLSGLLAVVAGPVARAAQPATLAPQLPTVLDGSVLAFARMGPDVVVAGDFTQLRLPDGTTITQRYLFAYDFETGAFDRTFRPSLNGPVLALAGSTDAVYVGGSFTLVNGYVRAKLARLTSTGQVDPTFASNADARVQALALSGSRLFVGGQFTSLHGVARSRLAEVSASTGSVSRSFDLPLTGVAGSRGYASVKSLAVSSDGTRLLVAHTAQRIAGQVRYGVAIVDVSSAPATVSPWATDLWQDGLDVNGGVVRITGAAWGPSGNWFVTSNTGGDRPPVNDSVQRFDLSSGDPTWVTRMFDSTYSIEVGPDGTVYAGGHFRFTEAPGSMEPYPGDPSVNYGYGIGTQGARVLGSQVVMRDKVAALSPATGKALNWWSSANGHKGVTALLATGETVLIGQDGTQVDGRPTGRSGIAAAYGAPVDDSVPQPGVAQPLQGANLPVGPVPVSGTATAPSGVAEVQVEVKRDGRNEWLQADGSWGPYFAFSAQLADPGGNTTGWTLGLDLPDVGDYVLLARARGTDGSLTPSRSAVRVLTNDPTNSPPITAWSFPAQGQSDFSSSTITVRGTSSDPDGVQAVTLTFRNLDLDAYVGPGGTVVDFASFSAHLATPGATTTSWSLTVQLPSGQYRAVAKAKDNLGAVDPRGARRDFAMYPGNNPPRVSLADGTNGRIVTGGFRLTGVASDDKGVRRVSVWIADTRFGLGPQLTGTFGVARWVPARVASVGATRTRWTISVPNLPVGSYTVTAYAQDNRGLLTPAAKRPTAVVHRWPVGVQREPSTSITSPGTSSRFTSLEVTVSGSASSPAGVTSVGVAVRDISVGRYLQDDGSFGPLPVLFPATLASPGATTTSWTLDMALPRAGVWRLDAVAVASDGAVDSSPAGSRRTLWVFPGDEDPTVELAAPQDGATVSGTGGVVTIGGRALDDRGVNRVQLLVRKADGTAGVRSDRTLGRRAGWFDAFLTNSGGTSTNWSVVTPALPAGAWIVSARAVDSVGKTTLEHPTSTFTVVR